MIKGTSGHALDKKRTDDKLESVRRCFEKIKGETVSVVDALEMVEGIISIVRIDTTGSVESI